MKNNYYKNLSVTFFLLIALFAGSLFLFGVISHEVLGEKEETLDLKIFSFFSSNIITPQLTGMMKIITYFGSSLFLYIAFSLLVLFCLLNKNRQRAIEICLIGIGGFLINYFAKLYFHRARPDHPLLEPLKNFSFPSGHAALGFIFYGLLTYLVWKTHIPKIYKWLTSSFLILFSLLIGFSRIYLRVHFASDVIAGFCMGSAWLALSILVIEKIKKRSQ